MLQFHLGETKAENEIAVAFSVLAYLKALHFLYTLQHMQTDLACDQFLLNVDLLKEPGLRPCQIFHKMLVCLSVKSS